MMLTGGEMLIDIQAPDVGDVSDTCKPETLCDTTSSDNLESAVTCAAVKMEYDVMARRPGKMVANSTSAGRRRNAGGLVRLEERRFRCAECFKAFKFKHHLQVYLMSALLILILSLFILVSPIMVDNIYSCPFDYNFL